MSETSSQDEQTNIDEAPKGTKIVRSGRPSKVKK
jgi:hypothetical protein